MIYNSILNKNCFLERDQELGNRYIDILVIQLSFFCFIVL